ncbi:MAG: rRNA pseudouridine synthase [Candidatus Kerfeldbacteria bacterium]|nr:rRNA pseudouridine synthase [Candidatus Kerfeldbacteria bacterium]
MRINKFIAASGIASRRKADALIVAGQVMVNGIVQQTLGTEIDPDHDRVTVSGREISAASTPTYLLFHKPVGYVCTHARHHGEQSIFELLPETYRHLAIAGRLDKDSSGLLILSDDGNFINELVHPRYTKEKEYEATLSRPLNAQQSSELHQGVRLEEGVARVDRLTRVHGSTYQIILHQGWKRQIRRMVEAVGAQVVSLVRRRIDDYQLGNLAEGSFREFKK